VQVRTVNDQPRFRITLEKLNIFGFQRVRNQPGFLIDQSFSVFFVKAKGQDMPRKYILSIRCFEKERGNLVLCNAGSLSLAVHSAALPLQGDSTRKPKLLWSGKIVPPSDLQPVHV
jgi:hypothetical protein